MVVVVVEGVKQHLVGREGCGPDTDQTSGTTGPWTRGDERNDAPSVTCAQKVALSGAEAGQPTAEA